jgi:hypothetical protein
MDDEEARNPKHQITKKSQYSNWKFKMEFLVIGDWSLEFIWRLGFGILI